MVNKRVLACVFAVLALATAAVFVGQARAAQGEDDAKVLARLDDDWSKAAATKDADKVAAYYAEDGIAYPPDAPIAEGKAAAKKIWAAYFADSSFVSISWKTVHADAAKSGDLGFTTGTYEVRAKGPKGEPVVEKGKYSCIWRKQKDGSWKAVHDMWNADSK